MSAFEQQVGNAISETRILVLGTQVLVGAVFDAFFGSAFDAVPRADRLLAAAALALLLLALAALVAPAAFHRIAERGVATRRYLAFVRGAAGLALAPLALGLALSLAVAARTVLPPAAGLAAGGGALALAAACWFGPALSRRKGSPLMPEPPADAARKVQERIDHVLAEVREVLPGAQALLGFQLSICFVRAFDELPRASRLLHLASFGLVALATVLLMTPAAVHRIVERGEPTERFLRVAGALLVAAMAPLALGLSADFLVVVRKVTESAAAARWAAAGLLCVYAVAWFGAPLALRRRRRAPSARRSSPAGTPAPPR